jgi:RpiR family carbohydrate utilization transcriptional regulator
MQNILEVVRNARADLRRSDRKVADIVLTDPQRILNATVAETADLAQVSQPTVIRFCIAVGCSGFQDFKLRLAHSLALGTPATHSVLLDTDEPAAIVEKIFEYTITSLDWARHHLDHAALGRAIAILEQARRIEFMGCGASGIVASDAQQKFPQFGVPCGAQQDSHQQITVAAMLQPGDVVVAISQGGATRPVIEAARTARESGARVIGITGGDTPLTHHCDVSLIVATLDNASPLTPIISRIGALAVVDILAIAVALRRDAAYQERFVRMKRRINELRASQQL